MRSDDLLFIFHCVNLVMKGLDTVHTLNPDANGKKLVEPTKYPGDNIAKFQVPDTEETCSSIYGDTYIK